MTPDLLCYLREQERESIPVEKSYPHLDAKLLSLYNLDTAPTETVLFAPFSRLPRRDFYLRKHLEAASHEKNFSTQQTEA